PERWSVSRKRGARAPTSPHAMKQTANETVARARWRSRPRCDAVGSRAVDARELAGMVVATEPSPPAGRPPPPRRTGRYDPVARCARAHGVRGLREMSSRMQEELVLFP